MLERDPRQLAAWGGAALLLVLLAAWYLARSRPTASAARPPAAAVPIAAITTPAAPHENRVVVDVAGAVKRPGVYRLTTSERVEDALRRAGGPTRRADLSQLNRAAKLEDGRQILVPTRGRTPLAAANGSGATTGSTGSTGSTASTASAGAAAPDAGPIDLNTATLEQLDTLDGVGPSTAQKILEYREQHGGFKSVDELDQVSGIGEKRLATLREHVRV